MLSNQLLIFLMYKIFVYFDKFLIGFNLQSLHSFSFRSTYLSLSFSLFYISQTHPNAHVTNAHTILHLNFNYVFSVNSISSEYYYWKTKEKNVCLTLARQSTKKKKKLLLTEHAIAHCEYCVQFFPFIFLLLAYSIKISSILLHF